MKTPNREDLVKKKQEMVLNGPTTLTYLMSRDKDNIASDHIYLHIDSMHRADVFVGFHINQIHVHVMHIILM